MLERKKIKDLNNYFLKLEERKEKGVYFYRICGYSEKVGEFKINTMIPQEEPA